MAVRVALNLLTDPWIPVARQSGVRTTIAPAGLTDLHDTDPVVSIDWPRADFRVATLEFLIGLLATACPPEDGHAWLDGWEAPPDAATLAAALAPIAHAFELDGDGPRFCQDIEDLVSDAEPIERLLIESPGASTIGKNTDVLVHRDRISALGRAAAAVALYTFQAWGPAGGAGNRTGLRGGGPLVTVVAPGDRPSLWRMLWANVPCGTPAEPRDLPRVFPWLVPTVASKDGRVVTPETAHPLQCWWGMPRRIRLDFTATDTPQPCGLTGTLETVAVRSWRQRPHGVNYAAWGGVHPLTPVYQLKAGTETLPVHPQLGGVGYRHWLGLVTNDQTGLRRPARTVVTWREERMADTDAPTRLVAAGYDMDNMKARGFVETEMPLPAAPEKMMRDRLDALASRLVRAAEQVASLLRSAVRGALFSAGTTVPQRAEALSALVERLWSQSQDGFFAALEREARRDPEVPEGAEEKIWLAHLRDTALRLFDEAAPMEPDAAPLIRQGETVPRLVRARRALLFALLGHGNDGGALFTTLGLSVVESRKRKKARAA